MKYNKLLGVVLFLTLIINASWSQVVGGFSPATSYYNTTRMVEFTNRIFGTNYTNVPQAPNIGYETSAFLAQRGASFSCTPSCSSHFHKGFDQGTNGQNSNLFSPMSGVVTGVGGVTGKVCIYNSNLDLTFVIIHCVNIQVSIGQTIQVGDYLADAGSAGATAVHTHTELRYGQRTAAACPCPLPNVDVVYDPLILVDLVNPAQKVKITIPNDGAVGIDYSNPIIINWDAFNGASGYRINITTDPSNFDVAATPMFSSGVVENNYVGNSTQFSFNNAQPNVDYYVVIRAFVPSLSQSYVSNIQKFTTRGGTSCNPSGYNYNTPVVLQNSYNSSNQTLTLDYYNNSNAGFVRLQVADASAAHTINEGFYCDINNMNYVGSTPNGYLYYNLSQNTPINQNNQIGIPLTLSSGNYCLTIRVGQTGAQSEYSTPTCFTVNTMSSINNLDASSTISLKPNPANSSCILKLDEKVITKKCTVQIFNSIGQVVQEQTYESMEQETTLDTSNLSNGIYYLIIQTASSTMTTQLMIN